MNDQIKAYLKEKRAMIKNDLAQVGITPRQFARWGGDFDYAEWELIAEMQINDLWDGFEDYNEITGHPELVKTLRWQAAYNSSRI